MVGPGQALRAVRLPSGRLPSAVFSPGVGPQPWLMPEELEICALTGTPVCDLSRYCCESSPVVASGPVGRRRGKAWTV
jgi:hypothetical protein